MPTMEFKDKMFMGKLLVYNVVCVGSSVCIPRLVN